ncbi:actin-interacting protein 1 isoform X2 [Histomonas meleagridis]|uniref:actin-interacting protein 1 isoform X2 n=1 Tax=Histomonas meleagridis TaxID=135588 RepID=UPI00355A53F3|nr:actin-interacting protein 1 isoform X2 [Histomonas meleagridis]KAH0798109.1 actin-interacting protein 1 isoform X2 [Histomonas meleagridis]
MSLTFEKIIPPHPVPRRALGFFIGFNERLNRIAYGLDNIVYLRGLTNIFDCDVYNQHQAKITIASYSPTGRYLASADEEGHLRVWAPTKQQTLTIETRPIAGAINDLSWTEDNERLAVVGKGAKSYGCVINATNGSSLGEVMGHTQPVNTCAVRAQRPFSLVTAGDDSQHVFYKGPPFKFHHTGRDHEKFILCARYSPDGSVYATTGLDGRVVIYDGRTGDLVKVHQLNSGICCISFSPDSKNILCAMMDGAARVITVADGTVTKEYKIGDEVYQQQQGCLWTKTTMLSISLNGDFNFLNEDGSIRTEIGHTAPISAVTKIKDGYVSGDNNGRVLFWKYNELSYACFCQEADGVPVNGIATISDDKVVITRADGLMTILNTNDASVVKTIPVSKKSTGNVVAHGDLIVTFSEKNLIIVNGGEAKTIQLSYVPTYVAIDNDGKEIAVGGEDKLIHLLTPDGNETGKITGLFKACAAIAYSPDNTMIAATSENREIMIWKRGDYANPLIDGWRFHSLAINKIIWIDNGNLITLSKDRSIRMWSMSKRRKYVEAPRAHEQSITDGFLVDDSTLLTVGLDGCIRTWKFQKIE